MWNHPNLAPSYDHNVLVGHCEEEHLVISKTEEIASAENMYKALLNIGNWY